MRLCGADPRSVSSVARSLKPIERSGDGYAPRLDLGRFGFIWAQPDFIGYRNDDGTHTHGPRWTWVYHAECMKLHNPPGLADYGLPENW